MGWSSETQEDEESSDMEQEDESQDEQNEVTEENDMDTKVDISALAPSAMDSDEAVKKDHTWKIMVWGNPSCGKTHFSYTMPDPVCIIDTENKSDDITYKFSDKEVFIWQPSDFDEAIDYRDEALSLLSEWEAQTGEKGTLVIDSVADMWEWSQHKFKQEKYPNSLPEDVSIELQNWPVIKEYHNKTFRKPIEECNFNVCFTSIRKDDVGKAIEEDLDTAPDKPGGESTNVYKVNSKLRLKKNGEGVPFAIQQKSGVLRFKYAGLEWPTFEKHKEIVERLKEIEANGAETVGEVAEHFDLDYDIYFTETEQE